MINFSLQKVLHTADGEMPLNVNARIESGQFISLYGASGTGKTSILRMLAGFMKPDAGFINVDGASWFDGSRKHNLAPQQRKIGFVFQDYALFPNMNVRENISFGASNQEIVNELLDVTGLSNLIERKVQTLSGGQQQRVALARAIAAKPALLLLDEPLSAVDDAMRVQLQNTLRELHHRYKLTTILVSHNANEVLKLSDVVFHLDQGCFQQQVAPAAFFQKQTLTGRIISFEQNGNAVVLIDDHVVSVAVQDKHLAINEQVEITCTGIRQVKPGD